MNAQGKIATARTRKVLVFPSPSKPATRLLVPREHGTWGLLLFPLISGTIVGYGASPNASLKAALWFLLTALSAFLIYQPLESLLELSPVKARSHRQQRIAILAVMALAVIATAGVLELFNLHRGLVLGFGLSAFGMFCPTSAARHLATHADSQAAHRRTGTQLGSSRRLLRCHWPD